MTELLILKNLKSNSVIVKLNSKLSEKTKIKQEEEKDQKLQDLKKRLNKDLKLIKKMENISTIGLIIKSIQNEFLFSLRKKT